MKKNMTLFFCSDLISGFTISIFLISLNWVILQETESALQVSYLMLLNACAGFIISLVGGIIVDRYERKKILYASYFVSAIFLSLIVMLIHWFGIQVMYLYLCSIMNGALWSIYLLTSKSFLQELLNESDIAKGMSFIEISLQMGTILAALFAGILLKYLSISKILILNVVAFLICGLLIEKIEYIPKVSTNRRKKSGISHFLKKYEYGAERKTNFIMGVMSVIPLTAAAVFSTISPVFVYETLKADSIIYGFSDMLYGIGAISVGFLVARVSKKSDGHIWMIMSIIIAMVIYMPLVRVNSTLLFLGGCFVFGNANTYIKVVFNIRIMRCIPSENMGRFLSMVTAVSLALQSIGVWITGYLMDIKGGKYGFFVLSTVMLVGLIFYFYDRKTHLGLKLSKEEM